jgi:hypothetical protein
MQSCIRLFEIEPGKFISSELRSEVDSEQRTVNSEEFAWLRHGLFIHPIGSDGWGIKKQASEGLALLACWKHVLGV